MLQSLTFRRPDGTLVGQVNGLPYHIIQSDPLWPVAQAIAANMGNELPFEPAPPPSATPPVLTRVYKVDVWRRASDQEAATMDGMLASLPVKQRRLWEDARYLETTDDYWPLIFGGFTQAFGATRAAELLAPSDAP